MDEERWKKAKDLFHEALEQAADERKQFLDEACGEDAELRQQVDQLLASYDSHFMQEPAAARVAEIIGTEHRLKPGQEFGRYRIEKLIGTGGMGEVYLANDSELDRRVALKLLRAGAAEDKERIGRFIREARAASALNHPNILTIHDVGSFEDSRFIVSEYIEGPTLRERMHEGITAAESIEITCQIAAALNAAHAAGIVHRDIKPENVMIRRDGLVKVLDFGLAKLTEADDRPIDQNAAIISRFHTSPGLVMGTVAYMSPEQAKGQPVDSRTDLWSLGVVLHEMLTGNSPFKGDSVADLVNSILKHDADSLDLTTISQQLKPICTRALARDRDARYQSANDLLKDLQGEKKRMEYATHSTPYITVSTTDDQKTQLIRRRPTLSAEYIVTSVKRHKYASLITVCAIVLVGVGLSVYKFNGAPRPDGLYNGSVPAIDLSTTAADLKPSIFASSGRMAQIAISPDGKFIAYVTSDGPEKNALRVRERESMKEVEIVPAPPNDAIKDISFSPDSSQVYYRRHTGSEWDPGSIYTVSISGGASTKIVEDAESGGSISPDGKMLAFNRGVDEYKEGDDVIVANADGSNERVVVHSPANGERWVRCGKVPAWSPDGKSLACWASFHPKEGEYIRIATVNVANGSIQMRDEKWADISGTVFMPDGSLIIAGKPLSSEKLAPTQLWLIAPNIPPRMITSDFNNYTSLSATRKGDVLVAIQDRVTRDIWTLTGTDTSLAKRITTSGEIIPNGGFSFTPDGRILYSSRISGDAAIWIMDADGGKRKPISTTEGADTNPSMTRDGKYIIFLNRIAPSGPHVFRMDADGKNRIRLTNSSMAEFEPTLSPDGKWVYFIEGFNNPNINRRICKVSIEGGEPICLAGIKNGNFLDVSPKNGRIAYEDVIPQDKKTHRQIKIISPNDGKLLRTLELPLTTAAGGMLRWTPDGQYIAINNSSNGTTFDGIPVDRKGPVKRLFSFSPGVGRFIWSQDGKQFGYLTGTEARDAVVITNKVN